MENNNRRTAAKVKGDYIDFLLSASQKPSEPRQYADYPEQVLEALRQFHTLWGFPDAGIPSKKQKGLFERWVSELQKLTNLCGSDAKLKIAMQRAFDNYESQQNKHLIKSPISVYSDLVTAVSEINRAEMLVKELDRKHPEKFGETVEAVPAQNVEESIKRMKLTLKKMREEGETE